MKSKDRQYYNVGYVHASTTALMLFGYEPSRFRNNYKEVEEYQDKVIEWWLSTQNPDTAKQRGYRFYRFFRAWQKDERARAEREGQL